MIQKNNLILFTFLLLVNAPIFLFAGFELSEKSAGIQKVKFSLPELDFENVEGFTRIRTQNTGFTTDIGYPELPVYSVTYHVDPFIEYEISLNVISSHIESNIQMYPAQNGIRNIKNEDTEDDFLSTEIVNPYPENNLWVSDRQNMRGEEFITVSVTPCTYFPSTQELEIFDEIEIEILESGSRENPNYQSKPRSRVFEKYMENFSPNYSTRVNEAYQPPAILYICGGSTLEEPSLHELLEWRHQRGYIVYTVAVEEIGNNSENIQEYIENAYFNWDIPPEFVTLVGDASGSYEVATNYEYYSGAYGEGDWPYSLLEGDDFLHEVIIGRLSVRTPNHLGVVVNKILNYEKANDMGDDWYESAALIGDPYDSGISTVITNEYIEELLEVVGFENIYTKYNGSGYSNWIENQFNTGVLYMNYRGYIGTSGFEPSDIMEDLTNYTKHPFATFLTCDTGSFDSGTYCLSETLLRAGTPSSPLGAVAAVGSSTTYTHTAFNNILAMGIFEGIFIEQNFTAGEALAYGKLVLANTYPSNPNNNVDMFSYWNNLMGDASTHLWTKRPEILTVSHPESILPGSNFIELTVVDENNEPVENAMITLLKGEDEIFTSGYSDFYGYAALHFSDNTPGDITVTVVKQDCKPYQGIINILENNVVLSALESEIIIVDDGSGSSIGNADGIMNPGEIIELLIPVYNSGSESAFGITTVLQSISPFVEIVSGLYEVGEIPENESIPSGPFLISILPETLDEIDLQLGLEIISESDENWMVSIPGIVSGSRLEIDGILVLEDENLDGILDPGEVGELFISLHNSGQLSVSDLTGFLTFTGPEITISDETGNWGNIDPGQSVYCGFGFGISANSSVINGARLNLELELENETGYNQSEILTLEIGTVSVTDPLGPDNYGYYLYDNGDTDYEFAPVYDWIEIDPDYGGPGVNLGLIDNGNGNYSNSIATVDLPFPFTFYGVEYSQLTICTNGWISFGETNMESFRNYELPGAGGPSPMVAVFWDDLKTTGGGTVNHYADIENGLYIVEWSDVKTFNQNSIESFQVILIDSSDDTPSGDDELKLQYKEFNNTSTGSYPVGWWDDVVHGAYCSVGLENHFGNDGLEYTFYNQYPTAAKPLEDYSALLITTRTGSLYQIGDTNIDGFINVLDIVVIVNHILEIYPIEDGLMYLADVNTDGLVDILDIVFLVNMILED